MPLELNH